MNIYWITQINENKLHKTSRMEIAEALRRRGHSVKLVIERNIGEKRTKNDDFFYLNTVKGQIFSRIIFNLMILLYFPFIAKRKKIDVILLDGGNVLIPFTIFLKILRIPLILDIRTLPTSEKSTEILLFDISLFLSKYVVNGLTTITPELKKVLIKKYRIENLKIGIWTSGVSLNLFKKPIDTKTIINFSKNSKYFYLMYHGGYNKTRGIENLIRSIAELEDSLKDKVKLIIIGINKNKIEDLKNLGEKLNINKNLEFIPPIDYKKIPLYIDLIDVGVIPLPPEYKWWHVSSPLKTLEYLAMGRPVIVTNIPFHESIFNKGQCGVLIKDSNPRSIASAITYLYNNREKLDDMGETGRKIIEKYYTWDIKSFELENFIKTIL